jgi:hypothetical protein
MRLSCIQFEQSLTLILFLLKHRRNRKLRNLMVRDIILPIRIQTKGFKTAVGSLRATPNDER